MRIQVPHGIVTSVVKVVDVPYTEVHDRHGALLRFALQVKVVNGLISSILAAGTTGDVP